MPSGSGFKSYVVKFNSVKTVFATFAVSANLAVAASAPAFAKAAVQ